MKLRSAWTAVAAANKSTGKADIDLREHLEATDQMHLPQSAIMLSTLEMLKGEGLIEEAYLRGSLGRGHGDIHSDIDFFIVIKPENVEKAYKAVSGHIASLGDIVTVCHDRLVADYGGIGFMFIARDGQQQNNMYQFDLYMAIKGVAPAMEFSIKPRIHSNNPSYRWMEEYGNVRDTRILPDDTKAFIQKHTTGSDVADHMELLAQEMLLTLFVTHKHMKRGQLSRTIVDNSFLLTSCVEMMQAITGYTATGYSPLYLGNEVVNFCKKNGDDEVISAADRLEKLFTQEMGPQKLRDVLSYTKMMLQTSFPDRFETHRKAFEAFENEILAPAPEKNPANASKRKFRK